MILDQFNDFVRLSALYHKGRISAEYIAQHLGISARHTFRLLGQPHPPRSRQSWNRLPTEIKDFVVTQKQAHPNYNCQWLSELASDRFTRGISQTTVWRILKAAELLQPTPTVVKLRRRFESPACGDLIQMDTTWGYWLGDKRLYLTILLDDHSRYLLTARWALQETLWHNMMLIRETVEQYGTFKVLYTDNASWFKVIRHNRSIYQTHRQTEYESEITRACRDLGMVHVTHKPYEPQGKGKVERIFRFIQERFVSELDSPEIPLYVINKKFQQWMQWYNTKHVNRTIDCVPKKRVDHAGFTPLSGKQLKQLDDIFCVQDTRLIDTCNQFSYEGVQYTIPGTRSYAHQRVEVHVHPQRKIRVWHHDRLLCEVAIVQ